MVYVINEHAVIYSSQRWNTSARANTHLSVSLYCGTQHWEPCVVPDLYYANMCCQTASQLHTPLHVDECRR